MNAAQHGILDQSLVSRQRKIQTARNYLVRTQQLFDAFGSPELKATHARFGELESALNATQVRLVVLGEFTRGKSMLLNALLGIEVLPTAMETTTAVNTFLRTLPPGRGERFILIHYVDGRPAQEVPWTDDQSLMRWGTELDANNADSNADARLLVDYIEIFLDHPLLRQGLELIDTPGLKTIIKHHEQITRKAIAESHVALWVQATDQLGGNESEWQFMSETLRGNFQKFLTVVNKWDRVLEPEDSQDQLLSEAERVKRKLDVVKSSFAKILGEHQDELARLTDADHLMGVSAKWAQSQDPEQRRRSGVDRLASRIADMVTSGEAMEQIILKPLTQLATIQTQLAERIDDESRQLDSSDSLEQRRQDLRQLELDIQSLEQDEKRETADSQSEHERASRTMTEQIRLELTAPLAKLKDAIEDQVTESYIRKMLARKATQIGLPDDLDQEFQRVSAQVDQTWQAQKAKLETVLAGLRAGYLEKMENHAQDVAAGIGSLHINLPALDLNLDFDFSAVEEHHANAMQLQAAMDAAQDDIDELSADIAQKPGNEIKLRQAEADVVRYMRQLENLGSPPTPITYPSSERVSDWGSGFLWLSATYRSVTRVDDSNVKAYERERQAMRDTLQSKEAAWEQARDEDFRLTRERMSLEVEKKRKEKFMAKLERETRAAAQQAKQKEEVLIVEMLNKLSRNLTAKLADTIRYLDTTLSSGIATVFMEQARLLENAVREQMMEPLNAKRSQLGEIETLLHSSQAEIDARKTELAAARQELTELHTLTLAALNV